jgi:nucleotide-binding universal stress UspA family protein
MSSEPNFTRGRSVKILIPISSFVDREKIAQALHALSVFKDPGVVLFHVVEVPSRTSPVNTHPFKNEIAEAEVRLLPVADWLRSQNYNTVVRVVVARDKVEGIVTEANEGDYSFVLMMKRKMRGGIGRLFHKSTSEAVIRSAKCLVLTTLVD